MSKAVSDEEIIAGLLKNGTVKATAAAVGVSERTIYGRMKKSDFKALYRSVRTDFLRKAVFELNNQLGMAVEIIVSIMQNDKINPAIRLRAAGLILDTACKFSERLNKDEYSISMEQEIDDFFDL